MIEDMRLELPHRLGWPPDKAGMRVALWFFGLWLLAGLVLILAYLAQNRGWIETRTSLGWRQEEDLAKGPASDGPSGGLQMGVTLVRSLPRVKARLDMPSLPAPPSSIGTLAPPKFAATKPVAAAQIADAPAQSSDQPPGNPTAQSEGLNDRPTGAEGGAAKTGAGSGRGDKGISGVAVAGSEIAAALTGWTLIGTEGAFDGSEPSEDDERRAKIPWSVYYAPDGKLIARWTQLYARVPHGRLEPVTFEESGTWSIQGEELCQSVPRWGYGLPNCFHMRKVEAGGDTNVALYYTKCGGLMRCYAGRLGPEGVIRQGKVGF